MNQIPPFPKWLTSSLLAIALLTGVFVIWGDDQALPDQVTAIPLPPQEDAEPSDNLYRVSEPGEVPRYVRAGTSLLEGIDAAGYAMLQSKFESTDDFMVRGNHVLRAVFENLQGDQERIDEIFSALGSIARSNVPTASIA